MRASTASHAENKCSTYTRYASALFSAVSLYLLRLFSKGFVFPLPIVSGKTSDKELLLFLFLTFLADCCILFTITSKKTKCSTALSAPIFLPLLFCSRGVFFSVPTRTSVVLSRSAFCSAKRAIKPVQGYTGLITAPETAQFYNRPRVEIFQWKNSPLLNTP